MSDRYTCADCGSPAPWGNGMCKSCQQTITKSFEDYYGGYDDDGDDDEDED